MPSNKSTESPHNPASMASARFALRQLLAMSARMLGRFWGIRSGPSPKTQHRVYSIWVDPHYGAESQPASNLEAVQPALRGGMNDDPASQSNTGDHRRLDPLARAAALWAIARLKSPPSDKLENSDMLVGLEDGLELCDTEQIVRLRNELWSLLFLLEGEDPTNDS